MPFGVFIKINDVLIKLGSTILELDDTPRVAAGFFY
jgi:hypothetical protein